MNGISGNTPLAPSATKLATGVNGSNIKSVADTVAHESAGTLDVLTRSEKKVIAADISALKVKLGTRLSEDQIGTALMAAGAIMGGPQGLVFPSLLGELRSTLACPAKLDALADKVAHFGDRVDGESLPTRGDVFHSMNSYVTSALIREHVPGENVPTGTFLAGAWANSMVDKGGYNIAQ